MALPSIPKRFFQWYCHPSLQESILGDLEEQFEADLSQFGLQKARQRFLWNVLRFFRKGIIKPADSRKYNNFSMIKNYYKVSMRNILRNKTFSLLNVLGLSVGIASCILILIYVHNELSYDKYNTQYNRTFRVLHYFGKNAAALAQEDKVPVSEFQVWGNAPVADALLDYFPQIEHITRFTSESSWLVEYKGQRFQENNIPFADSSIYQVFDWDWIARNPQTALSRPNTIILSKSLAYKLFGSEDPIGKTIILDGEDPFEVTAIYEIPANSHFSFPGFISMSTFINRRPQIFES